MDKQTISNRYRILQELSEGGFGRTFLAEDLHLPTKPRCVVKQLKLQFENEESINLARRLFEQEAEVLYRLGSHPNIPNLLAHFEEEGEFYLVQELIEGYTLAQEFAGGKRFTEKETVEVLRQILETLTFVHSQKVIHRDIKPSNLIRRYADGKIFLIDFGAVKQVGINQNNQSPTFHSTVAIGSEGYMPSEQTAGKPRFASDLYALGLVMIEGLTGLHPVKLNQNQNTGEFVWQHKTQLRPDVEKFISRLVRYDYRQRYNTAAEAGAALNMIVRSNMDFAPKTPVAASPNRFAQPSLPPQVYQTPPSVLTQQAFHPPVAIQMQQQQQQAYFPPPTIIAPVRPGSDKQKKGALSWLWNNDLALGAFVVMAVFGLFFAGGYALVKGLTSTEKPVVNKTQPQNFATEPISAGAFEEAISQANEAIEKEPRATTKFEWEEIGNHYKRAATLLSSIQRSNPVYEEAQSKIAEYRTKSQNAFQKAKEAESSPRLISNNSQPSTTTIPTNYPSGNNPAPTTQKILKTARMPAPRREKSYLVFNSSEGDYIGKGLDWVFTSSESKFTANGSKRYITLGVDGNDKWFHLTISVPDNYTFQVGSYTDAGYHQGNSNSSPSMSFSGDGRGCTVGDGSFNIHSIAFNEAGTELQYLDISFKQRCQNTSSVLLGRWRYDITGF